MAGVLLASATTIATSLPPAAYLVFDRNGPCLFEREGILVHYEGFYEIADSAQASGRMADHTHATFQLKNERGEPVTFSTERASFEFDQARVSNKTATTFTLEAGESRAAEVRLDFDFRAHASAVQPDAKGKMRLGEILLKDGRRIEIDVDVHLRVK
jgi:hypothetical protein